MALKLAIQNNHYNAAKYLIANGADINWYNTDYFSPLEHAIVWGNLEGVQFLVENGADINGKDLNGKPLYLASDDGKTKVVEYLIKKGVNINVTPEYSNRGNTSALTEAVLKGWFDIVKLLVENGADLEYQNGTVDKQTIIIVAARNGSRNILEYLIKKGAKINYQDTKGKTALMHAVSNGYVDNVKVLLKYGADRNLKDKDGLTALDIAKKKKNKVMIEVLEDIR